MKAVWNNTVIANSDEVIEIEGTYYFPISSIKTKFFIPSKTKSTCPWKGRAGYLHIEVNGERNEDAAWFYSKESHCPDILFNRIAFWKGVQINGSIEKPKLKVPVLRNLLGSLF